MFEPTTIEEARKHGMKHDCRLNFGDDKDRETVFAGASWGRTRALCEQYASLLDKVCDLLEVHGDE